MAIKQPLVLLVDDEEDLCLLMQMTLARMGIKTHLAYRVEQAKKILYRVSVRCLFNRFKSPRWQWSRLS